MKKLLSALGRLEEFVLCLMLLQMGLSVFLQVVMRYSFHSAITWLDELVHIEVIFLTFFGASLAVKYGTHISVDVLKTSLKGRALHLIEALGNLAMAVYAGLVIYYGLVLIDLMRLRVHYTPTLRIPKHYLYFAVCAGLALVALRSLLMVRYHLSRARAGLAARGES